MAIQEFEEDFGESSSIVEKVSDFFDENPWAYVLFFLVCLALFLSTFFVPAAQQPPAGTIYDFNYGPVIIYKSVLEEDGKHSEKILLSSQEGAKMLSLFVLVPKELSQSAADVSLSSNGRISILKADPVYRVDAINENTISAEFSVPSTKNSCSFLVVMHSEAVAGMTKEELDSVTEAIAAKEIPGLTCEKANQMEKELNANIYSAATGE